jgi:hypothetical protein
VASRRHKRRKQCIGKIRYSSSAEALKESKRLRWHNITKKDDFQYLDAYPCKYCGGWHVGHQRRK